MAERHRPAPSQRKRRPDTYNKGTGHSAARVGAARVGAAPGIDQNSSSSCTDIYLGKDERQYVVISAGGGGYFGS